MIVVMGLYDDFIEAVAGLTRFKLSRRNILFLVLVGGAAAVIRMPMALITWVWFWLRIPEV